MSAEDSILAENFPLDWVNYLFDQPVTEDGWVWTPGTPGWEDPPVRIATLVAETFEDAGRLLARFTDAQLDQGLRFLISMTGSEYLYLLNDLTVPLPGRLRVLRSFVPLFEQIMARRCPARYEDLRKPGASPLNGICFMWWDILPISAEPENPAYAEFDAEVLRVLRSLLAIPHDACRESALHGLGEWADQYPLIAEIIDDFLRSTPNLHPALVAYAERAKTGAIM